MSEAVDIVVHCVRRESQLRITEILAVERDVHPGTSRAPDRQTAHQPRSERPARPPTPCSGRTAPQMPSWAIWRQTTKSPSRARSVREAPQTAVNDGQQRIGKSAGRGRFRWIAAGHRNPVGLWVAFNTTLQHV
jgi:hypothetical protein